MDEVQTRSLDSDKYLRKATQFLYIITISIVTILGVIKNETIYNIIKLNLLSVILSWIIMFYAKENNEKVIQNKKNLFVVVSSFLFSLICVFLIIELPIYHLWLIGPMIIVIVADIHFGLSVHLLLAFLLSIISGYTVDRLIYNFILGALACILAKYIMEIKKVGYALIIFLSSNISLMIIMNNFMRADTLNMNIVQSIFSSILLFCIVGGIYVLYRRSNVDISIPIELEAKVVYEPQGVELKNEERMNDEIKYEEFNNYLSEDFMLLRELKAYSNKLYHRSIQMGDIAYQASQRINIQADLTRVGGYYCKIGRIVSDDYVIEGVHILENSEFPQSVIDIVRQHNLKYGNPLTKEAAVVMLTDNIIASIDTMKSMNDRKPISNHKLIDGIFSLRLKKGNLEESGLGITELKILKEFFQEVFKD